MAIVRKYYAEIISILNPAKNIYTVVFASKSGRFRYSPGQFLHLAIDDYDGVGQWPESRCFSIQSSPCQETLQITYSVKGSFTSNMQSDLRCGSMVWLKLPYGNLFTQEHCKKNTVFVAGGTGITPFLSLFQDESFSDYLKPRLYFGFRNEASDFCKEELDEVKRRYPQLEIFKFNQDHYGILDIDKIYAENQSTPTYFISGPQQMITAFKAYLLNAGLDCEKIRTDEWE